MGRPVELRQSLPPQCEVIAVSIPDFMGRPVELSIIRSYLKNRICFNPRFYGEAGRTRANQQIEQLEEKRFNPRFYGEAGRTIVINEKIKELRQFQSPILWGDRRNLGFISRKQCDVLCFNPRFYGETGGTKKKKKK